ncbi:MAG: YfiT family bacillithiol transferase [Vicinamibacterales bacterium]
MNETLSYPIGRFDRTAPFTSAMRAPAIEVFADLPFSLRRATSGLTDPQFDTPYRPGGWTVRQLVHHVADSHMNGYIRLKLALTEDAPTIKPYDQDQWATLADSALPPQVSLSLLESLHARWVAVWQALDPEQYARTFQHPELGPMTVDTHLHLYAWHCRHHLAHITGLRQRNGW